MPRQFQPLKPFPDYTEKDWALVQQKAPCALISREVSRGISVRPTMVTDDGGNIFAIRHNFPGKVSEIIKASLPFEIIDTGKTTVRVKVSDDWLQEMRDIQPFRPSVGKGVPILNQQAGTRNLGLPNGPSAPAGQDSPGQGDTPTNPVAATVKHVAESITVPLTNGGLNDYDRILAERLDTGWTEHARTQIVVEDRDVLLVTFVKRIFAAAEPVPDDTDQAIPDETPGDDTLTEEMPPVVTTATDPEPQPEPDPELNALWNANAIRRALKDEYRDMFQLEAALQPVLQSGSIPFDATLAQAIEIVRRGPEIKRLRVHVRDLLPGDVIQTCSAAPENKIRHFTILEIGDVDTTQKRYPRPGKIQYEDQDTPREIGFVTQTVDPYSIVVGGPHLEAANQDRSCVKKIGVASYNWIQGHPIPQPAQVA